MPHLYRTLQYESLLVGVPAFNHHL